MNLEFLKFFQSSIHLTLTMSIKQRILNEIVWFVSVLLALVAILQGIVTVSGIGLFTSNLKIDTRKASIEDVIGGFKFYPTTTTSIRPTLVPTTSISQIVLTPTELALVEEKYQDLKDNLEVLNASEDFSIARVFQVNDFMELGISGFICYSENDADLFPSSASNHCPVNGFFTCFGSSPVKSMYYSDAYNDIDKDYLLKMTTLSEDSIDKLSKTYQFVRSHTIPSTLKLNIPNDNLLQLSCDDDYINYGYRKGDQKYASNVFRLGLLSLIFAVLSLILFSFLIIRTMSWILSFVLFLIQFGINFTIIRNYVIQINSNSNIVASYNSIKHFIVLSALHILIASLIIRQFKMAGEKQKEEEQALYDSIDFTSKTKFQAFYEGEMRDFVYYNYKKKNEKGDGYTSGYSDGNDEK